MMQHLKPSTARSWRETLGPRIYFAGKISKADWRGEILGQDRPGAVDNDAQSQCLFDPMYTIARRGFLYGGPFFVSCDHGCSHGPGTHGAGYNFCTEIARNADAARVGVYNVSLQRIQLADLIFAHIDATDCFGTLHELGYAAALRKPIFLHFGSKISAKRRDDFWFVAKSGVVIDGTTREAFQRALRLWRRCQPALVAA
jgi:hypothetical protein